MNGRNTIEGLIRELGELGIADGLVLKIVTLFDRYASRYEREAKEKAAERSRRYRQRHHVTDNVTQRDGGLSLSSPSLLTDSPRATKEVREKRKKKVLLPDDWEPKPEHFESAKIKYGKSREWVLDLAQAMRDWSIGNGEPRAKWDSVFYGFIRREAKGSRDVQRSQHRDSNTRGGGSAVFAAMAGYTNGKTDRPEPRPPAPAQPVLELTAKTICEDASGADPDIVGRKDG